MHGDFHAFMTLKRFLVRKSPSQNILMVRGARAARLPAAGPVAYKGNAWRCPQAARLLRYLASSVSTLRPPLIPLQPTGLWSRGTVFSLQLPVLFVNWLNIQLIRTLL